MPPTPLTYRPQTLKQAKKAYRKSGATVRLSESEKAMLERRAVLQERADRIKEREARRKANLKRKEERVQREREARHRMGIPTPPPKEGIHVGPSQSHLSEFMYAGVKRKGENEVEEEEKEFDIQKQGGLVVQEQQERAMGPPMSRQPLQTSCANASPLWMIPSQMVNVNSPEVRDFLLQENQPPPKRTSLARNPLQAKSANPMIQQKPLAEDKHISGLQTKAAYLQRPQASPMDQPPLRPPAQATITKSTSFKKPPLIPLPSKPEAIPENCFDDFFVSNTQIQRELSPPPTPPARTTLGAVSIARPPTPPPRALEPAAADEDAADLLAFISTQDLDFSGELTQIGPPAPQEEPHDETEADDEDFPDDELEDIVLEFELESSVKSSNATTPNDQEPKPDLLTQSDGSGSHYDSDDADDAELQAGLQLVFRDYEKERQCQEAQRAAECDAFDLSTQDLRELES
ncbi:hypothetical protein HO133_009030 [Letharia lupina]|uniref:Uncharacterized protein n=1 Tax=Letharia lupina TaxID=560253 RepID=A0A8H6CMW4_9LECA|nr:uncharacterized protein HO133_009030 [Letharia lupina]KAF6226164.1 hypothetical protein HO133_009030 [Letharia lupina]